MTSLEKITRLTLLAALVTVPACKSELDGKAAAVVSDAPATATSETPTAAARTLALDADASTIEFVGAKVTADHRGSFGRPSGELELGADGSVTGMQVSVDTTKVDIEPEKLEQHLRSPDFFDVETYPQAHFRLTSLEPASGPDGATHRVSGDLELRGVTKRISFPAKAEITDERVTANASFKIDRKQFGIVYAGMADDLIKDEVLLELDLAFGGPGAQRS
jgi:polyisoprenoid-binding protein YceI